MSFPDAGRRADERRSVALVACLLPLLAGAVALATRGALDLTRPGTLAAAGLAAAGWLAALRLARGLGPSWALTVVVLSGALALRLVFLAAEPALSDDLHRYVWEGALVAAGEDPYASSPSAAALEPYRQRWPETFAGVNHPEVPAAYPPLVQALHAGLVTLAGGAEAPARARLLLRAFYAACDLLACLPLAWLLRQRGRSSVWLVAWAWNPWVALEFAGSGHLDVLAILCTLGALACFPPRVRPSAGRAATGLALLVAGAGVKLLPVALVPFAVRRTRRPLLAAGVLVAATTLVLAPFVLATGHLPRASGLREYAFRWESFSLLYRWLEPLFARLGPYDEGWSDPRRLARALVLLAWLGLGVHAWRRRFEPARAALWLFGGFLALTPTLHPWYLAWIVPWLALRPSLAWCALVAAAPLLYWPVARWRLERVWEEPVWLAPVLAGTFWALFVLERARAGRQAEARAEGPAGGAG